MHPESPATTLVDTPHVASTGIERLDFVLGGGLLAHSLYLVQGAPGTGKTTLALQFLLAGAAQGERTLYVTLSESASELKAVAASHGWSLDGIDILELVPSEEALQPESQYTVFHPSEVEWAQTMRSIYEAADRVRPERLVLDSLSEMRILVQEPLRLRRQVLALKQFFLGRRCSVMLLDDFGSEASELQFASLAHGVITLEQLALEYGAERRRLIVTKMRGRRYRGGYHDFTIRTGGIELYPRLVANEFPAVEVGEPLASGNGGLDALLGGGLDRGSSTLLYGPAGVGKSILTTIYALAAARRGERAAIYLFDERMRTFLARSAGLGLDVETAMADGLLMVQQIDPAEVSPGQFAHMVQRAVEVDKMSVIVIDSLSGYMNAMPEDRLLMIHLHELFSYLTQRGTTALVTLAQHGPFAAAHQHPSADVSYLADSMVLLRYFEATGQVRQAISVLKKRSGRHEQTIREYRIVQGGYSVGEPLRDFQGVLTGLPNYVGQVGPLLQPGLATGTRDR